MARSTLLLTLLVSTVVANNCSITPIYVDFHSRLVDGGLSFQYGLFMGIGTPSQNQSLWPSLTHNETTFADMYFCQNSPYPNCKNQTHGFYAPPLSQTYQPVPSYNSLDTNGSVDSEVIETGTDTLNIFTHYFDPSPPNVTKVDHFPVNVVSNYTANSSSWFDSGGLLGLGPSSTLLTRLFALEAVSSRSFGLYMGTAYNRAGGKINGSLTLGGYDAGRFEGDVHSYPVSTGASDPSPFKIQVQKLTISSPDGSNTDLEQSSFDAFIATSQFDLSLPPAVLQQFIHLTSATPANNDDSSLQLPPAFQGNLTITLSSGLSVTYTASELRNVSNISPISAVANSASPVVFGASFLAHVYLMANYDSTPPTFHLATASPDAPYIQTETFCPNGIPVAVTPPNISSFAASGLVGAIIGGIVGGTGLSFVIWWCVRRMIQQRNRVKRSPGGRMIDCSKNPISAYHQARFARDGGNKFGGEETRSGKKSWESDEEGFDMREIVPQRHSTFDPAPLNQNQHHPPRESERQEQDRTTQRSISASKPTTTKTTTLTYTPFTSKSTSKSNFYATANVPLTPNTPLPLLAAYNHDYNNTEESSPQNFNLQPPKYHPSHRRSNSDETRRQLGLTVQTEFAPPPKHVLGVDFGGSKKKETKKIKEVKTKNVPRRGILSSSSTKRDDNRAGGVGGSALKNMFSSS